MKERITEIAHRGYDSINPENTVLAVKNIANSDNPNPDMIEIDVQPTSDGKIVVFHDEHLDDRENLLKDHVEGNVWNHTYEELKQYEIVGSNAKIPQLKDVLEVLPDSIGVNIELKDIDSEEIKFDLRSNGGSSLGKRLSEEKLSKNKQIWKPFVKNVISECENFENDIILSSFFEGALAAAREINPEIPLAFLFWSSIEEGLEVAERHNCEFVHPPIDMILDSCFFNQNVLAEKEFEPIDVVSEAHSRGRKVNVWTIDNWAQVVEMEKAEVDGLITSYPLRRLEKKRDK